MKKQVKRFWIVMREATFPVKTPAQGYFRHDTLAQAEAEAKRLSAKYREAFVVLGVSAAFAPIEVERVGLR